MVEELRSFMRPPALNMCSRLNFVVFLENVISALDPGTLATSPSPPINSNNGTSFPLQIFKSTPWTYVYPDTQCNY